ncbi:MAG: hypothetical protein GX085_09205 [Firmicutes bacterium]|nr:hypothetical protein [Bacillota bacterium]
MNQVTQENAAMVEEISASSQALHAEAQKLQDVINRFKVNSHAGDSSIEESRKEGVPGGQKNGKPVPYQPPVHETNGFVQDSLENF